MTKTAGKRLIIIFICAAILIPNTVVADSQSLDAKLSKFEGKTVKTAVAYKSKTKKKKKKKVNVRIEYRQLAKQKMYGYDTFQGGASDGKYVYQIFYNRNKQKCKIAKIKASSGRVVKVSKALKIGHGNDATYNYKKKEIVVTYKNGETKKLVVIDPVKLKIKRYDKIKLPEKLIGLSAKKTNEILGFAAIAYKRDTDEFIGRVKGKRMYVVTDGELNAKRCIKVNKYKDYMCQSLECTSKYILHAQSPQKKGQKYNIISVYDYDGNYLATINTVPRGREVESIFAVGNSIMVGEYFSHYKTTKVKKYVKVKTKSGKKKYKKKKVKVKTWTRDNYIFKTGI